MEAMRATVSAALFNIMRLFDTNVLISVFENRKTEIFLIYILFDMSD